MSPAAKGPAGPASLPVGRGWHDRPCYVGWPGATCPRDRGRWPRQAAGGYRLGHTMMQAPQLRSACPSRGDTPHPASPWPHRLTSSALARAATAP